MNFSNELMNKAKAASSVEELLEMAKAAGVELSAADAEAYFSFLKNNGPLSDEELESVAGGKGGPPAPKYRIGQKVVVYYDDPIYGYIKNMAYSDHQKAWYYVCLFENGMEDEAALESPYCGIRVVS